MTDLFEEDFSIFDREQFGFKKIKQDLTESEVEQLKASFRSVWNKWKQIQLNVYAKMDPEIFGKPKIESWMNGWNLRNHFWSVYRATDRQNENACLGVLLNKKQLQIYLMFQHYQSEKRTGSVDAYNQLLKKLSAWSAGRDTNNYYIWRQQEHELTDHLLLNTYLTETKNQELFIKSLEDKTFQLGAFYFREPQIKNVEEKILKSLRELSELYLSLISE